MKIIATFNGTLASFVGCKTATFDLPKGAVFSDLLERILEVFGRHMPEQLSQDGKSGFCANTLGTRDESHLVPLHPGAPLEDGEEVKFFLKMAGG